MSRVQQAWNGTADIPLVVVDTKGLKVPFSTSIILDAYSFASFRLRGIPGGGGYSQNKWVGVCGPLPKTLTLFMSSLQANLRPKSAILPMLFMSY